MPIGESASAFEWTLAIGGAVAAVAAVAALGTLVFAYLTVRGAQKLRRDEQHSQLLVLAADYVETGTEAAHSLDSRSLTRELVARHRLRAALDATGEELPKCRALFDLDWEPVTMGDADRRRQEVDDALAAALDELTAWLRA